MDCGIVVSTTVGSGRSATVLKECQDYPCSEGHSFSRRLLLFFFPSALLKAQAQVQFFQALNFPGGPNLVAADFNNDGKLDIATGNSVLLGNGDATFQAPLPLSVTGSPVVTADFNNTVSPIWQL